MRQPTRAAGDGCRRPGGSNAGRRGRRPKLRFCSNVTETADGTIYFTESTSAFTYADYLAAILEARGRGSLFRRDPDGTVLTLVPGLYFANGVTLTADGSALVFAELQARRLSKYWLTGPKAGSVDPAGGEPARDARQPVHGCRRPIWCAMVTPANAALERLCLAHRGAQVLWRLPSRLQPKPESIVWVVAFDPDTGEAVAGLRTEHPGFGQVTGVVEANGKLWLGSHRRSRRRMGGAVRARPLALPYEVTFVPPTT